MLSNANYNGRVQNRASIKNFIEGTQTAFWKKILYSENLTLTPISPINNLYIPDTIYCANLVTVSDVTIKENITSINTEITNKIMNLKPSLYTFKNDITKKLHHGFIAQDVEKEFPNLVQSSPNKTNGVLKSVNYLEIIPLLVDKIQIMQKEIDELKDKINSKT